MAGGYSGQPVPHPLAKAVERARANEAKLHAALERQLRRAAVPVAGIPEGGRLVGDRLLLDGCLYHRLDDGEWALTFHEVMFRDGMTIKWLNSAGVPEFAPPPPLRGMVAPDDVELEAHARRSGIPLAAMREWRERFEESHVA